MTNEKFNRSYDVFRAFLVENADYDGQIELPRLETSMQIPDKVITFSKAMSKSCKDFECWIVFYEYDVNFERLWRNPKRYLERLKKFKGVISPDFSLYRNMPFVMQEWNTYRGRALAFWMQKNGIEVIPNIRWGDERTYDFCFCGIEKNSIVSVGTHGCIKRKEDREYFKKGLLALVEKLHPKIIIVYGAAPDDIFKKYAYQGIEIITFESEFSKSRKRGNA